MGPVVGSVSSNHHRVKTLLPLTVRINRLFLERGVVSVFAIVSSIDIPACITLRLPGREPSPESYSLPTSSTVSYYHLFTLSKL
ncbi:MAG: hypothetical protein [Circular genetic element sp.]|nr:MAG: hypothetical protein [Circular genetic element sp.]